MNNVVFLFFFSPFFVHKSHSFHNSAKDITLYINSLNIQLTAQKLIEILAISNVLRKTCKLHTELKPSHICDFEIVEYMLTPSIALNIIHKYRSGMSFNNKVNLQQAITAVAENKTPFKPSIVGANKTLLNNGQMGSAVEKVWAAMVNSTQDGAKNTLMFDLDEMNPIDAIVLVFTVGANIDNLLVSVTNDAELTRLMKSHPSVMAIDAALTLSDFVIAQNSDNNDQDIGGRQVFCLTIFSQNMDSSC